MTRSHLSIAPPLYLMYTRSVVSKPLTSRPCMRDIYESSDIVCASDRRPTYSIYGSYR